MTQNYFQPHKEWSFRGLSSRKTSDNACAGVGAGFMPNRTSAETRCAVCFTPKFTPQGEFDIIIHPTGIIVNTKLSLWGFFLL
nr:MAG TPA: hypothetical protein [Caudoviricetes sp.]